MAERKGANPNVWRLHLQRSQILVSKKDGEITTPWGNFEFKTELPEARKNSLLTRAEKPESKILKFQATVYEPQAAD